MSTHARMHAIALLASACTAAVIAPSHCLGARLRTSRPRTDCAGSTAQLTLNPRHRSAHEHLGEAHLVVGNLREAEEHLASLERICLIPGEEYDEPKRAITEHGQSVVR